MNKQEAIEKIEELKKYSCGALGDDWISLGIDKALNVVKQIDEPEKPVLTKAEAEWVDHLTEFFDTPDALYYITRCGYEYSFTFDFWGDTYELPLEDGISYDRLNHIRERLVNAVVYGYEVEKEKLYTVEIPNPNGSGYSKTYLCKNEDDKVELFTWSHYTSIEYADNWKQLEPAQLTEEEIKEDYEWAWQFAEEVEE